MRNIETRISSLPSAKILRSKFNPPPSHHLTTMNAGVLVPIFVREVLPASTEKLTVKQLIRMSTPIRPVLDDCFLDTYFFFCPNRLLWSNWEEFMGENKGGYWTDNSTVYSIPQLKFNIPAEKGSVADYMGIPTQVSNLSVNALPFRAYALIWNDWFRDQNTMRPLNINTSSSDTGYIPLDQDYFFGAMKGGRPAPVSKFKDYFTSALPEPQRGPDVYLALGDVAPVVSTTQRAFSNLDRAPMTFFNFSTNTVGANSGYLGLDSGNLVVESVSAPSSVNSSVLAPDNLFADLSNATSTTINQLRMAISLQQFYEASARFGGRYIETLRGHFGVISPDARLQRPEYLGGKRTKINIQQCVQVSATNDVSPQGNTAAFSLTADINEAYSFSAVEHGYIIGVACLRTKQTYQYGLHRMWSRKDMIDFYFPEFAHIGEQAILNKEIFAQGNTQDDEVFGYQEAWAEYRDLPSRVSGAFRSNYAQSLDSWHYAEKLTSLPTLSEYFIQQSQSVIDRTLAVSSELEDQFLCDFCFELSSVLPMPMYSIPGFTNTF